MSKARGFSLKDQLFNRDKIRYLAALFSTADSGFDGADFEARVMARLPDLELKERIVWIAEVLEHLLPQDFNTAAAVIESALPPPLDPTKTDDDFGDFIFAPLAEFVARNGQQDLDLSLSLLEELTKRFSVEFAIRHFLNAHPAQTMAQMTRWASHKNYHLRRLASEGTRRHCPGGGRSGWRWMRGYPFLTCCTVTEPVM